MSGENYYLITALDTLGDLGEEPPMTPEALLEHVASHRRAHALVSAIFLGDDLLQREALAAGEIQTPRPVVLSAEELVEDQPLPAYLSAPGESHLKIPGDALWANYFRYVDQLADAEGSDLLSQWVGYEVALRNGLVEARSAALGLEASEYTVAEDLAEPGAQLGATLNEWAAADTPLSAMRVLDRARWAWIELHTPTFSFDDDELVAYAIGLMLLCRWHRMGQPQQRNQTT